MIKTMLSALVLALSFSGAAFAEEVSSEGQTTMKVEEATQKKNKVDGDIDQEITNAKLRAESGSKSKWSLSLQGGYTGGSLSRPFGLERPLLSGEPGIQTYTSADLGFDARYRLTKNDSFTLGSSISSVTPFQGNVSGGDPVSINDPSVGYSRVGKILGLQTVAGISYAYGTSISSKDADVTSQWGLSYNAMKSFQNGLSVGMSVGTGYNFFSSKAGESKNEDLQSSRYGGDRRTEWSLGLYPQAEYEFNDRYSIRTVFGYFNWKHLYGDQNRFRLLQTYVYQSVGVGISINRDIYLYPAVQFVPDNIRSDFTNFALSATINVF